MNNANYLNLEKSIIATLAYFNIFEYPLTLFEIWKNLILIDNDSRDVAMPRLYELDDISSAISGDNLKNIVERKNGFYFLKPNKGSNPFNGVGPLRTRQQRYYIAEKKFKRAKKISWLLSKIPYIKMIAVCNSLGYSNALENSDIDFFIVTAKNKIWITRFISTVLIKILNLRPKKNKTKDTVCLSFFVDENNLNLEKFQLTTASNHPQPLLFKSLSSTRLGKGLGVVNQISDPYLTYWTTQLVPLFNRDNAYEKFWQANKWVEKYLPNRIKNNPPKRRRLTELSSEASEVSSVNLLEQLAKKIQLKFLNPQLRDLMNKDTRVIINDGVLKLYSKDRREKYLNQWLETLKIYCL